MTAAQRITGALAAAVTPLREGGARIDEAALAALLDFYARSGLDGLFILGTTGEGLLLDQDERQRVAELVLAGAGSLQVIVHCGAQTTAQTTALAAHAAAMGAGGVAVVAPPYVQLAPEELVEHFVVAAAACAPLPFYLYEYADRSGYALPVAVVERVRERAPNAVGMKVSDAPFARLDPYLATGLDIFVGVEALVCEGLAQGAVGAISGIAAAFPEAVAALVRAPTPEHAALVDALSSVLSEASLQTSVKVALRCRGLPVLPDVRAPLQPLSAGAAERLQARLEPLMDAAGVASSV